MKMYSGSSRKKARTISSLPTVPTQTKPLALWLSQSDPVPALYTIGVTDWLRVNYPLIRLHQQSTKGLRSKIYHCTWHLENFCFFTVLLYVYIHSYVFLWHVHAELFISGEEFLHFLRNGSQFCFKASKIRRRNFSYVIRDEVVCAFCIIHCTKSPASFGAVCSACLICLQSCINCFIYIYIYIYIYMHITKSVTA